MLTAISFGFLVIRKLKGTDANRYIIWFFGNKEATELKVVLSAREGKKIVLKTLPFGIEQPYYKTYDYILTEVAAKVQQLFVEPTDLWKALWKAFDISIVNRRFYDEIKQAFDLILVQINKKGNPFKTDADRAQFAIRLLGRIIFCWFLKRKNILKEEALSSKAVLNYKDKDYYHELLEPLFFEVMNKPEKERIGGLPKIIAQYPFLNGGLFDANKETDFYDADTSTPDFRLNIENDWFYNFFSITLERYNFTVDENSSSNAEIAIDPEMLGRIFENLLAEQNPETGESARKATGSFYTPREIVDYMVEQSIAEYLKTALGNTNDEPALERNLFGVIPNQQLKLPKVNPNAADKKLNAAIEDFVHTSHLPDDLKPQAQSLLDALNIIKVLDPACGSGAFPIGILQKLISLKQEIIQVQNPKKQLSQSAAYKLKLETIQKSIYGVDIQPMAVELSRLRCWLSLVVDEENDNIKALPNLDFKFVCADSLIDAPDDDYVRNLSAKHLEDFTIAAEQYFNPDFKKKEILKKEIKRCLSEIMRTHDYAIRSVLDQIRKEQKSASANRLKQLNDSLFEYSYKQSVWHTYENIFLNRKVDFFNIQYFFPSAKKGFDVVIGNPPYIPISKLPEETSTNLAKQSYETFAKGADIYCLFYERGIKLLKDKAVICYISSNRFCFTNYGVGLRKYLSEKNILQIINFNEVNVFENANVGSAVVLVQKSLQSSAPILTYESKESKGESLTDIIQSDGKWLSREFFKESQWSFDQNEIQFVKQKIINKGVAFIKWKDISINRGITTGLNDVFIIPEHKKNEIVKSDPASSEILMPVLKGANIKRYAIIPAKEYLIYTYTDIKITNYPGVYNYLKQNREELENVYEAKHGLKKWYELRKCTYYDKFFETKLLWTRLSNQNAFAISTNGEFTVDSSSFAVTKDAKYLAAVLNSKVVFFYFKLGSVIWGKDGIKWFGSYFDSIPIPEIKVERQKPIIILVDYILAINQTSKSLNEYVPNEHIAKQFEELIDACVYELYFEEEVKAKEAGVLQLVSEQFKPIGGLKHPEQIKIIEEGYQLLREGGSEIRSRITRQKLVDEIAIIQTNTQ